MFLNRPKKKYKGQPVSGARIGHPEEAYVELQLGKSFAASGGDGGNALGATEVVNNYEPASDGNKNSRSALSAFGISRKQMELMGIGGARVARPHLSDAHHLELVNVRLFIYIEQPKPGISRQVVDCVLSTR